MRRPRSQPLLLPGVDARARLVTPLARATSRPKARSEASAPKPWLAVVLAVDTAATSGWAISVTGRRVDSGECDTLEHAELDRVVRWAVNLAEVATLPLVMVLEVPWGGSVQVIASLGVARERWQRAWRDARQSKARVVQVQPSTWRAAVLGSCWARAPRDEVRDHEQRTARVYAGRAVGADEAAAVLIARWAAHAAKVGRAIGKRASKASLRAWTAREAT